MQNQNFKTSSDTIFNKSGLISEVRRGFRLDLKGIHGTAHWARVRRHALEVASIRDADFLVVELFAFLHDSQRHDDFRDPGHGARGAEFAASLNGVFFDLKPLQMDQLTYAIRHHSSGTVHHDATIQSCWDGDRLDLVRLGYHPDSAYLSDEASMLIDAAWELIERP
jgi:uncharacterized protein